MTYLRKNLTRVIVALMTLMLVFTMMPATMWTVAAEDKARTEIKVTDVDGKITCVAPSNVEEITAKHEKKFVKVNMIFKPGSEVEVDSGAHISMNGVDLNKYKDTLVIFAYPETDFDPSVKKTAMLDLYIYPEVWKRIKKGGQSSDNTKPNVSAAEFNAKPVDARWAAPREIRVKFDRNLKVNSSPQDRKVGVKLLTSDGREVDLGPNDDFAFHGDTIFIHFLAGQKKEYTGVVFKKGSLVDVNDENIKNTEDIRVSNVKVEKTLSRVGIEYEGVPTTNLVPKEGKTLNISASGYNLQLDNGHDIKLKLYSGESGGNTANFKPTNIEATLNVKDNTAGNCYVTIPENKTGKRIGYIFKYSVDGGKTYDDFFKDAPTISFRLIQEADENDAARPQPTPQPQPVVPTPTPQPDPVNAEDGYRFTVGNDAVWNGRDLLFKIENPLVDMNQPGERVFDRFQGIEIDGKAVDKENYTAQPGSVVLTLKESYIRSLGTGKHTIKAKFKCANAATTYFTVTGSKKTPKPGTPGVVKKAPARAKVVKTGDSSSAFAFAIMFVLAGAALAGVATYRRKRA